MAAIANRRRLVLSRGKGRGKGIVCVTDDLVATAIEAAGGHTLWNMLRGLTIDLAPPRVAFKGHLRPTPWDALHGDTKLAIDQPSLLFASYDNPDIEMVGYRLDYLLALLIITMGGDLPSELRNGAS
jgi:hypothetical protein